MAGVLMVRVRVVVYLGSLLTVSDERIRLPVSLAVVTLSHGRSVGGGSLNTVFDRLASRACGFRSGGFFPLRRAVEVGPGRSLFPRSRPRVVAPLTRTHN